MPKFLVTTQSRIQFNGLRIEPGMSVEVVTTSFANSLLVNGWFRKRWGEPGSGCDLLPKSVRF